MKIREILAYVSLPAAFAVGVFVYALGREPFSLDMLVSVLAGGFLFYGAPYLFWAVIVLISRPSNIVARSGFIATTLALALIASAWIMPPDPSGLPMQWLLYWPLAVVLLIVAVTGAAIYLRLKAPNKRLQPTSG